MVQVRGRGLGGALGEGGRGGVGGRVVNVLYTATLLDDYRVCGSCSEPGSVRTSNLCQSAMSITSALMSSAIGFKGLP